MMKRIAQKGFTLIELLVVIAIIGILAGVVLTSLGSARSSAADSKVKSQLASMRAEAEIYATSNGGSYHVSTTDNVCASTATTLRNGIAGGCGSASGAWAAWAPLPGVGGTVHWCADSSGRSVQITAARSAGATTCQ